MIFLKLGGSLITDKARPLTARQAVIERMAYETAEALHANPGLRLVIGHGSGSFGHHLGARHGTRQGAQTSADWLGFSKVAGAARQLHQLVMQAFLEQELPVMSFSPSAYLISNTGRFEEGFIRPVQLALEAGLIPVVHGDVVFDVSQGATIFSTEQVFQHPGQIPGADCATFWQASNPACLHRMEKFWNRCIRTTSTSSFSTHQAARMSPVECDRRLKKLACSPLNIRSARCSSSRRSSWQPDPGAPGRERGTRIGS